MYQDIGYLLKHINNRIKERMDAEMKDCNLTFQQAHVLWTLEKNGGTMTQKEIEERLSVSHPTIVGIITRMENNGFVKTYLSQADRRIKIVELTAQAHLFREKVDRLGKQLREDLERDISEEDRNKLLLLLNQMYENLAVQQEVSND